MSFTEVLTILFILLKVFGAITWPWWVVFLPEIIVVALYVVEHIANIVATNKTHKSIKKHFKDF